MDTNEIARQVARDLATEFGGAVVDQTEAAIQGAQREPGQTRSWVIELVHLAGDVVHTVHFMMIIIPIAIAEWGRLKNVVKLKLALQGAAQQRGNLSPETAGKVIDAVAQRVAKG